MIERIDDNLQTFATREVHFLYIDPQVLLGREADVCPTQTITTCP